MPYEAHDHSDLVEELTEAIINKFETLPPMDHNLVLIAALEAVGWFASAEIKAYCGARGQGEDGYTDRARDYATAFQAIIEHELTK